MERAVGTTFKVDDDEIIVQENKKTVCHNEQGELCYFYRTCTSTLRISEKAGQCNGIFRKDRKNVIFIKK